MAPENCAADKDIPDAAGDFQTRRRICAKCDRPANVCLCATIPADPIANLTRVVVLQHPHERRHKLATVPVLSKCLGNCEVIAGRRLRYGDSKVLDNLHDEAIANPKVPRRAVFLFPGTETSESMEINQWKCSTKNFDRSNYVLIALDGTWKHAKEMMRASLEFLSKFAVQVYLSYDTSIDGGTIFDSDLILRKEPFSGCMSTMEAVAHCLQVLDPNGVEIEARLVEALRTMVRFQTSYLRPMKQRPKKFTDIALNSDTVAKYPHSEDVSERLLNHIKGPPDQGRGVLNWKNEKTGNGANFYASLPPVPNMVASPCGGRCYLSKG
nr:DTW domain-containing protein 2 [Ipomoea batatas]